jgi:hypothetical protein
VLNVLASDSVTIVFDPVVPSYWSLALTKEFADWKLDNSSVEVSMFVATFVLYWPHATHMFPKESDPAGGDISVALHGVSDAFWCFQWCTHSDNPKMSRSKPLKATMTDRIWLHRERWWIQANLNI